MLLHNFKVLTLLVCIFPFGDSVVLDTTSMGKKVRNPYLWPMARGPVGSHSTSLYAAPRNLSSSLAWTWHNPDGKFFDSSNGASLFDDEGNLYSGFRTGIRKFSPNGKLIWHHPVDGGYNDIPALMDGALYSTTYNGHVIAVSMESGKLLWKSDQVCTWKSNTVSKAHDHCDCNTLGSDIGSVGAHKGIVLVKTHQPPGGGACRAAGVNASTGAFLWDYAAEHLIWNFYPIINDDGESFLFQDSTGGVYHVGLDGREIWKAGIPSETWHQTFTDGGLQLGPNGVVYGVKAYGDNKPPGTVRAFRVTDGKFLWESPKMPFPPNAWPAVGRMRKNDRLTVMAPFGTCGMGTFGVDLTPGVWGLDAETGELLWSWDGPAWKSGPFRSEVERMKANHGDMCMPNPFGNPTLDASGHLYFGLLDGKVYELARNDNGPGVHAVSTFDAEAAFSSGGASVVPGTMAIASCDTLYVFKG